VKTIGGGSDSNLAPGISPLKLNMFRADMAGAQVDAVPFLPGIELVLGDSGKFVGGAGEIAERPFTDFLEDFGVPRPRLGLDEFFVKVKKLSCGGIVRRLKRLNPIKSRARGRNFRFGGWK